MVKPGGLVKVLGGGHGTEIRIGEVYRVHEVDEFGSVVILDDVGCYGYLYPHEVESVEYDLDQCLETWRKK